MESSSSSRTPKIALQPRNPKSINTSSLALPAFSYRSILTAAMYPWVGISSQFEYTTGIKSLAIKKRIVYF
jgi:hypothetical protein